MRRTIAVIPYCNSTALVFVFACASIAVADFRFLFLHDTIRVLNNGWPAGNTAS